MIFITFALLLLSSNVLLAQSLPPLIVKNEIYYQSLKKQEDKNLKTLERVKFFILNGHLDKAFVEIDLYNHLEKNTYPQYLYYYAWLMHLRGDYLNSQRYFTQLRDISDAYESNICPLSILNYTYLNSNLLSKEWERCEQELNSSDNQAAIWTKEFLANKNQKNKKSLSLSSILSVENSIKLLQLKSLLLLNSRDIEILPFEELEEQWLSDEKVRELLGILYFRKSSIVDAYKLIYQDNNINALNIKGNILLLKEEPELALAEFLLANKTNPHSFNSLERLIPLTLKLKRWDLLDLFSKQILTIDQEFQDAYIYQGLTTLNQKLFLETITRIDKLLSSPAQREMSTLLDQRLIAYLGVNDPSATKEAKNHCLEFKTEVSCWIYYQDIIWKNFSQVQKDKTPYLWGAKKDEFYQRVLAGKASEFVDEVIFDQKNINEFDMVDEIKLQR